MNEETIARQKEQDHSHESQFQYSGDPLVETRLAGEGTGMKSKGNAEITNQFAARED
jgi:hypothetical protein